MLLEHITGMLFTTKHAVKMIGIDIRYKLAAIEYKKGLNTIKTYWEKDNTYFLHTFHYLTYIMRHLVNIKLGCHLKKMYYTVT